MWIPVLAIYGFWSSIAFVVYGVDKLRAQSGGRRVRERTMHLVELMGGWPGGLVAQTVFRHKRRKPGYLRLFWTIVAIHLGGWAFVLYRCNS